MRVVARSARRLAGRVAEAPRRGGRCWFRPTADRFSPGKLTTDAGAAGLVEGQRIVAELLGGENPGPVQYRLLESLSDGLDPLQDPLDIAHELGLRLRFPAPVHALAARRARLAFAPGEGAPPRIDLRHLPCITIDPASAADFDDAISWRELDGGAQEVGVHIADVSWFVEVADALDEEALERATSIYMPGLTLPMLPDPLSAVAASLCPDADRPAVSVLVELDAGCRVRSWRLERSLIRSRRRLTYGEAETWLRTVPPEVEGAAVDWQTVLVHAARVAERLRQHRLRRGGLHLELPEREVELDEQGFPTRIITRHSGPAHQLIEEHMLLANELIGGWGRAARLPILFRVHERPRWERLLEFELILTETGLGVAGRNLADPRQLARVLEEAAARGLEEVIAYQLLRSLEKARYASEDCGHFGLGVEGYCHFTSPIRRYPDLHTHRVVLAAAAALGGADRAARETPTADRLLRPVRRRFLSSLDELAERTSGRELDAQRAERLALRVKVLRLLALRLGEVEAGRIAGVTGAGLHVQLDEYPIQGWVARERLPRDRYGLGARGHSLEGRWHGGVFAVGQPLRVRLESVSIEQRELELAPVSAATDS